MDSINFDMRHLSILLLGLLVLFSCEDMESGKQDGDGTASECVLPVSVQAGGEAVIQWDGFAQEADIRLVSSDAKEYDMDVRTITASGLVFKVPLAVPAGEYSVNLVQGEVTELGRITVTEASVPVIGLKVPSGAGKGEKVIISGAGFESGCVVKLVGSSGRPYSLETEIVNVGITIVIPQGIPAGGYEVYLVQDGMEWILSKSFSVYGDYSVKKLRRIEYDSPYLGTSKLRLAWDISHEEPVTLTLSQYVVDGDEVSLEVYDRYVCSDGWFELVSDGFESSNDMGMSYVCDQSSGFPLTSDVLIYGDDEPTRFTWAYDADGFLTEIASPSRSFRSLEYSEGNLIRFRNTEFRYENTELKNHPGAPDVVWGYMSLMEYNDPFVYFPYLLGWYDMDSALLPSVIAVPDPSGSGVIDNPLTYEFDEDGYVTSMSWGSNKIGYFFE